MGPQKGALQVSTIRSIGIQDVFWGLTVRGFALLGFTWRVVDALPGPALALRISVRNGAPSRGVAVAVGRAGAGACAGGSLFRGRISATIACRPGLQH